MKKTKINITRRDFMNNGTLAAGSFFIVPRFVLAMGISPLAINLI